VLYERPPHAIQDAALFPFSRHTVLYHMDIQLLRLSKHVNLSRTRW
jgi:hypothetical protein